MKLHFLQMAFLVGIAQAGPYPPVTIYGHLGKEDKTDIPPDESPRETFRHRGLCRLELFNQNGSHSPEIFADIISKEQADALGNCIQELEQVNLTPPRSFTKPSVRDRVRAISPQDIAMCRTTPCCGFIKRFIHVLTKDALKKMQPICVDYFTRAVMQDEPSAMSQSFQLLPDSVITANAGLIAQKLGAKITQINNKVFELLIKSPATCSVLSPDAWEAILTSTWAHWVNAECIARGKDALNQAQFVNGANVSKMPADVFKFYNQRLNGKAFTSMTSDQLSNYASGLEMGNFPTALLNWDNLTPATARGLRLYHLMGHFYGNPKSTLKISEDVWRSVSDRIFSGLSRDDVNLMASVLSGPTQEFFKANQVNDLLKHPEMCAIMRPGPVARATEISSVCFSNLAPVSQASVFASSQAALPIDILRGMTSTTLKDWEYKEYRGLRVFLTGNRKNRGEYLKHLGSDVVFDHPARLVTSFEDLNELKILQENMTSHFYANMGVELTDDDFKKLKPRVAFLQPFSQFKSTRPKDFWPKITAESLSHLISGGSFCKEVDSEILAQMNPKAYTAFTKDCYSRLRDVDKLPKGIMQLFPPAVFVSETAKSTNVAIIAMLTPDQLASLGAEASADNHPAKLFTAEVLNGMSTDHLAKMTATQWQHTPPAAYATISSPERLKVIPASAMSHWCVDGVKNVNEKAIIALTEEQAEKIGSECEDKASLLAHLGSIKFECDKARDAISRRSKDSAPVQEEGMSTMTIVLIGVGAAVGAAVIGFVIYRFFWSH